MIFVDVWKENEDEALIDLVARDQKLNYICNLRIFKRKDMDQIKKR